ncbi:MAG: 3-phosphoglycerate dehydrogenase [Flavobacteriales bacterium]|nr:3-phosphoglycerate dehydrogenase [Flavobacteriales bacterium]
MKKPTKVFIATTSFGKVSKEPIEILKNNNISFESNSLGRKLKDSEVASILYDFDAVIAGTENYTMEVLRQLPNLRVISRLGVGMDNIDLDSAGKANIYVRKCSTTPALAVAELSLSMFLIISRKLNSMNISLKQGRWEKLMGNLISGKTLGIIGLGNIGKNLIKLTNGFNLDYLAYDIFQDKDFSDKYKVTYTSLDQLLESSDLISIHLNSSPQNIDLIDLAEFKKMRKRPIIVNTSRGEVINEEALQLALSNNIISGAGLDVFHKEPYNGVLLEFENVFATPHIGSYASEIRNQMEIEAVENLLNGG